MDYAQLLYGLNEGFLQRIKPNYRAIAIGYQNGDLKTIVYCDTFPQDEDDLDNLKEAVSEAESLIENVKGVFVEVIYSEEPIGKLNKLDFWYFLRYDAEL